MHKKRISTVLAITLIGSSALHALDVRAKGGVLLADTTYLDKTATAGVEIAGYNDKRYNGMFFGAKFSIMAAAKNAQQGTYGDLAFEIGYRIKKNAEPYIYGGGVYQKIGSKDYGHGYTYGAGMRYVYCNGIEVGGEFSQQRLTYNSSSTATSVFNNAKFNNSLFSAYLGYRF